MYIFRLFRFRFKISERMPKIQPRREPSSREAVNTKKLYGSAAPKKGTIINKKGKIHAIIFIAKTDSSEYFFIEIMPFHDILPVGFIIQYISLK